MPLANSRSVKGTSEMRRKCFTRTFLIVSSEKLVSLPYPIKLYTFIWKDTASIKIIPQLKSMRISENEHVKKTEATLRWMTLEPSIPMTT